MDRREVLGILSLAAGVGILGLGVANSSEHARLRPPGAISEKEFLSKCLRCGLCVEACPFDTLKLASFCDHAIANGTPFFIPREIPCYMCDDIPCVAACPSDALDKSLVSEDSKLNVRLSKMGVAVIDTEHCIAYAGIQCDACVRSCPVMDKALRIDYRHNNRTEKHALLVPVVDSDYCTGCGKCEHACVTKKAAIGVVERERVIGISSDNYVKGWIKGDDAKLKDADTKINLDPQKSKDYLNEDDLMEGARQ